MYPSKQLLIGFICVTFLIGAVGLVQPPPSHADVQFGGIKKILKAIFPPCGPGTRHQRFKVSKDGNSVCDNNTGLWWQQNPNTGPFTWLQAINHCANLTLSGKTWRLPEVEEIQWHSLVDYSVANQADALNEPNGPFINVQAAGYWSATELAGNSSFAWFVTFFNGDVFRIVSGTFLHAWCVSGGKDAHGH